MGAMGEAGAGHALAQAAFVQEIALQAAELAAEEVGGDFDQAHDDVGANRGIGVLDAFLEGLVIGAGRAVEQRRRRAYGWSGGHSSIPRLRMKSR